MSLSSAWVSGKQGFVVAMDEGGNFAEFTLSKWKFPAKAAWLARNGFRSNGYQEGLAGFKSVNFSASGYLALNDFALVIGLTYRFFLGMELTGPTEWFVDGVVVGMDLENSAEDGVTVNYDCQSVGEFSISSAGGVYAYGQ